MAKRPSRRPAAGTSRRPAATRTARTRGGTRTSTGTTASGRGGTRRSTAGRTTAAPGGTRKKPAARKPAARTASKASKPAKPAQPAPRSAARTARGYASGNARVAKAARPAKAVAATAARTTAPAKARPTPTARSPRGERERGTLEGLPTPPSSLDLDRHASAARSGRVELAEALAEHTETGPALTGGDVDADWESAYSTGDEAPGGDMPTPDQGVVQDIGTALGVEYEDNEELRGADKIEARDRHRWELNPASSEDYKGRAAKRKK